MAKSTETRDVYTIESEEVAGNVSIPSDAFESIVCFSALEVKGVYCIGSNITKDKVAKLGTSGISGIRVDIDEAEKKVKVYIAIDILFGSTIPEITKAVSEKIKNSIENMTDFTVDTVNIKIADIRSEA